MNADAGDIAPGPGACNAAPDFQGAQIISDKVAAWRKSMPTFASLKLKAASKAR